MVEPTPSAAPTRRRHVGILVFDAVEVLDFAGPFEVFGVTGARSANPPFQVSTVAATEEPVTARNGLRVIPHHSFESCPPLDILVVPGGAGTRPLLTDAAATDWVRATDLTTELTLSVCTGSLVLATIGLLADGPATTHHGAYDELRAADPTVEVIEGVKQVDRGRIVTSAGISAGIDMSLGVVARLLGTDTAVQTARYMEYDWEPS